MKRLIFVLVVITLIINPCFSEQAISLKENSNTNQFTDGYEIDDLAQYQGVGYPFQYPYGYPYPQPYPYPGGYPNLNQGPGSSGVVNNINLGANNLGVYSPYYDMLHGPYRYRSPGLAFLLSFIIPGVGQYYNGQVGKGVVQEILVFGGIIAGASTNEEIFFAFAGVGALWSWIDAPISAGNINRRNRRMMMFRPYPYGFGHALEYHHDKYAIGLDVYPRKEGFKAQLTLHY